IDVDVLDGALESHAERRFQLNAFAFPLRTHVGKMFRLAGINRQIFWPRVLSHDHSFVNVFLRSDEKPAARLDIVERVSSADSIFHRYHHATTAPPNFAFKRRILAEQMTHQSFTAGQIYPSGFKANQAPSWTNCLH